MLIIIVESLESDYSADCDDVTTEQSFVCAVWIASVLLSNSGSGRRWGRGGRGRCNQIVVLSFFPPLILSSPHSPLPPLTDAPSITNKPVTPKIRLNYEASQNIIVTYDQGNPPAEVQWVKLVYSMKRLLSSGVFQREVTQISIDNPRITTENGKTTLKLTNEGPDLGVTGTYKVRISNSVGNDEFEYNVEQECKLMYIYLVIHVSI